MVRIAAEAAMLSDSGVRRASKEPSPGRPGDRCRATSYSNRSVCFDLRRRSRENLRTRPLADLQAILPSDDAGDGTAGRQAITSGESAESRRLPACGGRTPSVIACGDATSLKREADVTACGGETAANTYERTGGRIATTSLWTGFAMTGWGTGGRRLRAGATGLRTGCAMTEWGRRVCGAPPVFLSAPVC